VYTYQWTLALTAASASKPIIILDRPNPIRADRFEGNILDLKFRSLVGQYAVALRYGLTPGELPANMKAMGIGGVMGSLFATHPPMEDRIRALQERSK